MSGIVDTLVEMGFSQQRAELAVSKTNTDNIQVLMDWLLSNEEEPEAEPTPQEPSAEPPSEPPAPVKSMKCDDCGKLFETQLEVEYHATKSAHTNFSESTEEKKPLSEEEKKEQLAKIEAKLKQRRLEREAREKEEALIKERNRIKSGKDMLEAKLKHDELEMKKIVEQRKREKEEEKMARQRVKDQIEQDKLARKAKYAGGAAAPAERPQVVPQQSPVRPTAYEEVVLQIRLTNGASLTQKFQAKEPLSAVRLYVETHRSDGEGPFTLMTSHPKKVFGPDDYEIPLNGLGLGPRAILIVSKS